MIRNEKMTVLSHKEIARDIYEMVLQGELVHEISAPGQFLHIKVGRGVEPLLRRPISIANIQKETSSLTIIFRAEGKGTKLLADVSVGASVDVLGPLGNGFPIDSLDKGKTALLVGGGIGVPPLYELTKQLNDQGIKTVHVLGFQSEDVAFYKKEFLKFGPTYVATVDGTLGQKGFVTDIIHTFGEEFDLFYSCGPKPMLKALQSNLGNVKGYISLEERMGCGVGACFACVCHKADDPNGHSYVKVCSDGPVFPIGVVAL